MAKTVQVRVVSVTFRSDHLGSDGKTKLLRPSPGDFKDTEETFEKPEWNEDRSHPASFTKNQPVKVDLELEASISPKGETASLSAVEGKCDVPSLAFKSTAAKTLADGQRVTIAGLVSSGSLPNQVDLIEGKTIEWTATVDGAPKSAGRTGPHTLYVTFDRPGGKMQNTTGAFEEKGPDQIVTEERLRLAIAGSGGAAGTKGSGANDEKEVVDEVFMLLLRLRVGYFLGRRWDAFDPDHVDTGISPPPTLHHYLWRCNANTAKGECHNIAASFVLACRILGVKGPFELGLMFPWGSRRDQHPTYPKRGDAIMGRYNAVGDESARGVQFSLHLRGSHAPWKRNDPIPGRATVEAVKFVDGRGQVNNFEGVARYKNGLYAIGDAIFARHDDPDENASDYFALRSDEVIPTTIDRTTGGFDLIRADGAKVPCRDPYPPPLAPTTKTVKDSQGNRFRARVFRWED